MNIASNNPHLSELYIPQIITQSVGSKRKRGNEDNDEKVEKRSRTESPLSRKGTTSSIDKRKRDHGSDQEEGEDRPTKRSRSTSDSDSSIVASSSE